MLKKSMLAAAIALATVSAQAADTTPSMEEMWQLIQTQQAEINALKAQLNQTDSKLQQTEVKVSAAADAIEQGVVGSEALTQVASWVEKTSIGGYGEHHYNHFEDKNDEVDAHRFVLYFGHQFTDSVRFFSEFELEHGIAGEEQVGEVELEQAFIEWDYTQNHSVQLGQFLVPVGILNETHEPDTFYGTERNLVEKEIIPATWWETGVQLKGELAPGLNYNLALHSGLENAEGKIRSGRQKSAKANAEDFAYTARLKYTGIAGLELAATVQYQEDISQGALTEASAWLTEVHAAYTVGPFALRALWAEWDIDGDEIELLGRDSQDGWYLEPSYKFTDSLGVFARYSEYNTTAGFSNSDDTEVWEYGVNYWLTPTVVLKADYTDFVSESSGTDKDALNLGLGWSF
ncbi:porin [Aestuariicella hydrocarbonica]|uniref:Porin n=1 Tax=Pseudomaricurvus hydrocarbonicus TaxID=1470433 RepID=A0A9E5MM58_9GAMM|nr:porin [Aestuariicella hydrocarbonica]NHO65525.1 porin [Aestuariicella hydrocarbonica]